MLGKLACNLKYGFLEGALHILRRGFYNIGFLGGYSASGLCTEL